MKQEYDDTESREIFKRISVRIQNMRDDIAIMKAISLESGHNGK